jgi:hypothetical protein
MKSLIDEFLEHGYPDRLAPTREEFEAALVAWWFINQDKPVHFQDPNCIEFARDILYGRTKAYTPPNLTTHINSRRH